MFLSRDLAIFYWSLCRNPVHGSILRLRSGQVLDGAFSSELVEEFTKGGAYAIQACSRWLLR